jgi:lipooligosaccharide transport system permease protein
MADVARSGGSAWAIVEHTAIGTRRFWRPLVIGGVLMPVLTALSLGVGLGKVVNADRLGVSYFEFVTPGLIVASALMSAAGEATYPIMAGFRWLRQFHGMAATPLTPRQICDGSILWIGLRLLVTSALNLAILAAFGGVARPEAFLAVPVAAFTGLAFAAPILALSASIETEEPYPVLQRLIVMPMFLFSATFYPLSQLPGWGQWVARFFPLWHGTEVARGAAVGHLGALSAVGHLAYLAAWLVVGTFFARRRFAWRLTK